MKKPTTPEPPPPTPVPVTPAVPAETAPNSVTVESPPTVAQPAQTPDEPVSTSPESWSSLWLTDRDIAVFTTLAAVVLVLLVVRWVQLSGWGRQEIEIERMTPIAYSGRLDLNEATWVELAQLDGVGEALAVRIVEDRQTNGPFLTVEDLDRVKGIGPKLLDRLRPYLRVASANDKP